MQPPFVRDYPPTRDNLPPQLTRGTGGERAYQISFLKLMDEIWLATARRLRPVLAKARLEADGNTCGQFIVEAKMPETNGAQPAAGS